MKEKDSNSKRKKLENKFYILIYIYLIIYNYKN